MTDPAFPLIVTAWSGLLSVFASAAILWTIGICYWQQHARRLILALTVILYARYMVWRGVYTINADDINTLVLGWLVYGAEVYAFIQVILFAYHVWNPLERQLLPLTRYPTVDVFVTVVNEPLEILRRTLVGCLQQTYPQESYQVHILDDGNREDIRALAQGLGCSYVRRCERTHAKAGNLNHALSRTSRELIAIFDVDHVPTPNFLRETVGFFEDTQVAFVQTPHHFYNPDIFQKNLRLERSLANEQSLFYRVLQAGRDRHNSAFFAGSCGLFRRGPLQEIGGFRTETVTEDIHTSMTLHARGYRSCYLNKVLAVGLSPESFDSFIKQRTRWAMGHVQLLFRSNPFLVPGLTLHQRMGYFASIWYFLHGLPRLISLVAPLFALLLGLIPITADVWSLAHFFGTYYLATVLMLKVVDKGTRNAFWSDVYETAGSVALTWALVKTMLRPWKLRPFVITPKGRQRENRGIAEFKYVIPNLVLFGLLIAGITTGIRAWLTGTVIPGLGISLFWGFTNLILISVALLSAVEWPEWRKTHRLPSHLPCLVITGDEHIEGLMVDLSEAGAKIQMSRPTTDLPSQVLIQFTDPQGECVTVSGQIRRQVTLGQTGIAVGLAFSQLDDKSVDTILGMLSADASVWNRPPADPGIWGSFCALVSVFFKVWMRARRSRRGDERLRSARPCRLIFNGHGIQGVLHDVSRSGFVIKTPARVDQLHERGLVEMAGLTAHVRRIWAMDCDGVTMAGFRIEAPILAQAPRPVNLENLQPVCLSGRTALLSNP